MADKKVYFLSESDLATIKHFIKVQQSQRNNTPTHAASAHVPQANTDVYMAFAPSGIPGLTQGGSAGSTEGTGSDYAMPGSALCNIYSIDTDTGELQPVYNLDKQVYNLSATVVPTGWLVIHKEKFGSWVAGLGAASESTGSNGNTTGNSTNDCPCFDCLAADEAPVGACGFCTTGAAYQYTADVGEWLEFPTLGGIVTMTYVSGCTWASDVIFVEGTGTGTEVGTASGDGGSYQWVLVMAASATTLELLLVSGNDIVGLD